MTVFNKNDTSEYENSEKATNSQSTNGENWIETVINVNKDMHDPLKPNSKSQILSERYSNITPESSRVNNSSIVHLSSLSNSSKVLSLSPISKLAVVHNETTETCEMFSFEGDNISSNAGYSLRNTRKQIGRALTSLNKSKTDIIFEGQDDSMAYSANTTECEISLNDNKLIYTDLTDSFNTYNFKDKKNLNTEFDDLSEQPMKSQTRVIFINFFSSLKSYLVLCGKVFIIP